MGRAKPMIGVMPKGKDKRQYKKGGKLTKVKPATKPVIRGKKKQGC